MAGRAGKWKGVQVAVKIVEHNSEADRDLSELRESVLSTAIQHPNVVRPCPLRFPPGSTGCKAGFTTGRPLKHCPILALC